ncbi:hypothetical protein GPLA_4027 [Paraglaciecola polaris LMG 21857]|uniref:Uncharacterized protein n=1 Tax=Paraglaciecola polaris LMG 21857 TaxID=1129793 RepID=K6ZFU9_9ALTE|nr:hypothetical protein GPLA_4027 [Paraglaciecola polaris LMG 21857]
MMLLTHCVSNMYYNPTREGICQRLIYLILGLVYGQFNEKVHASR